MRKLVFCWCVTLFVAIVLVECSATQAAPADQDSHSNSAADTSGSHGHEQGAPLGFKEDLAIWSLVTFIFFFLVLKKFAWGPLSEGLNNREAGIRTDIAGAETARLKAEEMLAGYARKLDAVQDEVKEIIAEARRDAEHTKQDIIETAQKEADASKQRAIAEINRARDAALKELFDSMATQVTEATEHVLGRSLSGDDQDRLVEEALSSFRQN